MVRDHVKISHRKFIAMAAQRAVSNRSSEKIAWSYISKGIFYLFLLVSPLNVYGLGTGLFNFRFSRILMLMAYVSIIYELMIKKRIPFFKFQIYDYIIFMYFLLALISGLYVSNDGAFATRLFGLIECIFIMFLIRIFSANVNDFIQAISVYILSSIFVILGAVSQIYRLMNNPHGYPLPFQSFLLTGAYDQIQEGMYGLVVGGFMRVSSTFGEPNMMAGYCSLIITLVVAIILIKYDEKKYIAVFGYSLLAVCLVITMAAAISKTGVFSTLVGLILLNMLIYKDLNRRQRSMVKVIFCFVVIITISFFIYSSEMVLKRLESVDSGHIEFRLNAIKDFCEAPYFGVGYGNYKSVVSHTIILTALLELGILGGIMLLIVTTVPFYYYRLIKKIRMMGKYFTKHTILFSACLASYAAVTVGLYVYDFWLHTFTWICIGFLISFQSQMLNITQKYNMDCHNNQVTK